MPRTREDILRDWPDRPKGTGRLPYGYVYDEAKDSLVPVIDVIVTLDRALDQLDAGISLREASEWLCAQQPDYKLSHQSLKKFWDQLRENHPKKITPPKKVRQSLAERIEKRKKHKIGIEKRRIRAAEKRIQKATDDLTEIKSLDSPFIEIQHEDLVEFESLDTSDQEVIFQPNPGPQYEFLASSELEVLYGGAAGGGKSYALLADPIRYFGSPAFNGLLLRRTNDELRELIWKSQELYTKYPGITTKNWSQKASAWTFPAGGHLWFTYLERDEDLLRYQGQAFTWIGFDEVTQYPTPNAWNYLRSRLRTTDKELEPYLAIRGTTNPGGPGHGWVKQMFVDPAPPNTAFPATDIDTGETLVIPHGDEDFPESMWGQPTHYRKFIPAKLRDNPHLGLAYKSNLLSLPEQQRRQLLDGDWNIADGAAFPEFRVSTHVCKPFEIPDEWRKFRSADYGYSQKSASAVHWYAIDPDGTLYVYRELYTNQKTGKELAKMVLDLERGESITYGVLDSSVWRQTGQNGPSVAEEMIQAGCRWRPADRSQGSRVAGKNQLHERLKIDPYSNKPSIIFFDTCRQIIADLQVIPVDPKGSDDIDDRYANDHAYDSIRYGIMTRPRAASPWDTFKKGVTTSGYKPADTIFGY